MISEWGLTESMLLSFAFSNLARPSTLSVTYPFSANWRTMVSLSLRWDGLHVICQVAIRLLKERTGLPNLSGPSIRECHNALSWGHYSSHCTLMTSAAALILEYPAYFMLTIHAQCHLNNLESLIKKMSDNASRRASWSTNQLKLNVGKIKAMVCGNPYYINQLSSVASDITISNSRVQFSSSVRNLGLVLDDWLCSKEQINEVCKRANTLMYRLYRLTDSTALELRKHLIQAPLLLLVDYCSLALCNISVDQDKRLQEVLNTGICYIFGARKSDQHILHYRRQLSWITNVDRRLYFDTTRFYKLNQSSQPAYLANFFLCIKNFNESLNIFLKQSQ